MTNRKRIQSVYPLTPLQEGMLFHHLLDRKAAAYVNQLALELRGRLDVTLLEQAFRLLVQRHQVLRTVFHHQETRQPMQLVLRERRFALDYEDISSLSEKDRQNFLEAFETRDLERGFDLTKDLLMRAACFKCEEDLYRLLWSSHHIIMDGWCMGILFKDLLSFYRALIQDRSAVLEEPVPFGRYMKWLSRQDRRAGLAFWKDYLRGCESNSGQSLFQSPKKPGCYTAAEYNLMIDNQMGNGLIRLAECSRVTLNTLFQTLWGILLQQYTLWPDVVFGTVVSGRPPEIEGIERMVGLFINTLPARIDSRGAGHFTSLLSAVQQASIQAKYYEFISLAEIQAHVNIRSLDHILVFENFPVETEIRNMDARREIGLGIENIQSREQTHYDLNVIIAPGGEKGTFRVKFSYNTQVIDTDFVRRLAGHWRHVMAQVIARPDLAPADFELVSGDEKNKLLYEFNTGGPGLIIDEGVHHRFEGQVEQTPDLIVLVEPGAGRISYRELNRRSARFSTILKEKGVEPAAVVGLMGRHRLELGVGLLGILKTGAAFLPVDPAYPEERIRFMMVDSGADLLLTEKDLTSDNRREVLPDSSSRPIDPGSPAYIIYTSGTTGSPRGVIVNHCSLVNTLLARKDVYRLDPGAVSLQLLSIAFDAFTAAFFTPLISGARNVLLGRERLMDLDVVARAVREEQVSHLVCSPALFRLVLDNLSPTGSASLRTITLGGEELPPALLTRVKAGGSDLEIVHEYGVTEAAVVSSLYRRQEKSDRVLIGKPIANTAVYITGLHLRLQPVGVPGELCIAGIGLARGYLNRPELTSEKFLTPHAGLPVPRRLYRSGDLARFMPDGNLEFLGRIDQQLKIRGFRIEPGEIESRLLGHPMISQAAVQARPDGRGERCLAAYVVLSKEAGMSRESLGRMLREFLAAALPDYMVPADFVKLDVLPLTPGGKVDHRALPEPVAARVGGVAPRAGLEEEVANIWAEVLGIDKDKIGVGSNFFQLGGHSLKAMLLMSRIHRQFNVRIALQAMLETPTLEALSRLIETARQQRYLSIPPAEKREFYPLSPSQKRMYILSRMDAGRPVYNIPGCLGVEGEIDGQQVENAFRHLIRRHESLRTSFHMIGNEPVQRVHTEAAFNVEFLDLTDDEKVDTDAISARFSRPFDLSTPPLLRVGLVRWEPRRYLLLADMHHIVADGISAGILIKEFTALYRGEPIGELRLHYKDFAQWQLRHPQRAGIERQQAFWLEEFAAEIPVLDLPFDFTRPPVQSFDGGSLDFNVAGTVADKLKRLAAEEGGTLFMALLAVYIVLLARLGGQDDIVVGIPVAARRHADLEPVIGMFVNTLALRHRTANDISFREFFRQVKQGTAAAFENQEYPFEDLVDRLKLKRDTGRHPLFDVVFSWQHFDLEGRVLPGDVSLGRDIRIESHPLPVRLSRFDLTLAARESRAGIDCSFEYCTALFKRETIEKFGAWFNKIAAAAAARADGRLGEIDIVSEAEKREILIDFNRGGVNFPTAGSVHQLFAHRVEQFPDGIAVAGEAFALPGDGGEISLTYRELKDRSLGLAELLKVHGVESGAVVGLWMDRTVELVAAVLGVLTAGGAYLPIDVDTPQERLQFILKDSSTAVVVAHPAAAAVQKIEKSVSIIPFPPPREQPPAEPVGREGPGGEMQPAYVIYTSGTTGRPKGSLVEHRSVVRLLFNDRFPFSFDCRDVWTLFHSYCFDFSVWEMFGALLYGGTLIVVRLSTARDPGRCLRLLKATGVTVLNQTPSAFYNLAAEELKSPWGGLCLQYVIFGGEALRPGQLGPFHRRYPETRLVNMYGITETTVHVTVKEIGGSEIDADSGTVGRPLPSHACYIVDGNLRLNPVGVRGEILVGGEGLARGYLNRPELSAEKFITAAAVSPPVYDSLKDRFPAAGDRLYRSGDMARWSDRGDMVYQGRLDNQVKIRGYRIEPAEIESLLLRHGRIEAAAVVPELKGGETRLLAYVVRRPAASTAVGCGDICEYLAGRLAGYMMPAHVVTVDRIPLTVNGKVDRRALPSPELEERDTAPLGEVEERLAALWSEVLAVGESKIGRQSDFFELGGHSLNAVQVVNALHKRMGIGISIQDIFLYPTIAALTEVISRGERRPFEEIPRQVEREYYELSYSQKRLWIVQKRSPHSRLFNMPLRLTLHDRLQEGVVRRVVETLCRRHDSLRTCFREIGGEVVQLVVPGAVAGVEIIDLAGVDAEARREERQRLFLEEKDRLFDLERAPLFSVKLVKCGVKEYDLILNMHHLISDGLSMEILQEEFSRLYEAWNRGRECELPPMGIQYRDYACWHNRLLKNRPELQRALDFWKSQLSDDLQELLLPYNYAPGDSGSRRSAGYRFTVQVDVADKLKRLAADSESSLFVVLLAIFNLLLFRLRGQRDIVVGLPAAARQHEDLKGIVGLFVNTLVLRSRIDPAERFSGFLRGTQNRFLELLEYQSFPLELICDELNIRYPVISVFFNMFNTPAGHMATLEHVGDSHLDWVQDTKFPLVIYLTEFGNGIEIVVHYFRDLFRSAMIEKIMKMYTLLMEAVTAEPDRPLGEYRTSRTGRVLQR